MDGNEPDIGADPTAEAAFALSRTLYRRLGPALGSDADPAARQQVLDACEMTMRRLIGEPDFARPARFLFEEIRWNYALEEQPWIRRTVECHIEIARGIIERLPTPKRECGAFTRSGEPCRREAVNGSEFCPSHRHLELIDAQADEAAA